MLLLLYCSNIVGIGIGIGIATLVTRLLNLYFKITFALLVYES